MSDVEVNGQHSRVGVDSVTGNFYSDLGAVPLLGRLIAPDDVTAHVGAPVAVLGYEYWQGRFGGDANVVGKQIRVGGRPFTIIGVTRKWFTGMTTGRAPEVTIPITGSENRAQLWVFVTGRLKEGHTLEQARAQLASIWPEVLLATVSTDAPGLRRQTFLSMGLEVAPVATGVARDLRARFASPLYVLLGIVGLILIVACVNLANLMLARAARRSYELSVRIALGANRWVLARQMFAESLVLSAAGALLGLVFGTWGSRVLIALMTEGYVTPVTLDVRPDWRVLLVTAAITVVTAVLFGVAPAWRASGVDPASALQGNGRSVLAGLGKASKLLMVSQVALSLVLLMSAGLLTRSFHELCTIDAGFEEQVLQVSVYPKPGGRPNADLDTYRRQLLDRVSRIPGVLSVGFAGYSGPGRKGWEEAVSTTANASNPNAAVISTAVMVSPGFLETLRIRQVLGRAFEWTDDEQHPHVAIISSSLASRLFPSGNALGQRIRFGFMPEHQALEVVGIAGVARLFDLRDQAAPIVYLPSRQYPKWSEAGELFLRTRQSPDAIAGIVGREIESLGREYPFRGRVLGQTVKESLATERVVALLSSAFAGLALLLASIGLYGLMSYTVARRTREIGIRTALGARSTTVIWGVLWEALGLSIAGIAVGIPLAFGASRLIAGLLFGIAPHDLLTAASVSLMLVLVSLLASYVPARRASRIAPTIALRSE
jgi:predicted permease